MLSIVIHCANYGNALELMQFISSINQSEIGLIRIDLDWKLGFGLVRIHSD